MVISAECVRLMWRGLGDSGQLVALIGMRW
jgi:hypothetical protein